LSFEITQELIGLKYSQIIYYHMLWESGGFVGGTRPVTSYGHVEDEEEASSKFV
jgi:hypothetical protein